MSREEVLKEINRLLDNSSEEVLAEVLRLVRDLASGNSGGIVNFINMEIIISREKELLKSLDTDQDTGKPSNPPE